MSATLDFTALDGLAFAAERGRLPSSFPCLAARDLGPVIEMAFLARDGLLPAPELAGRLRLNCFGELCGEMRSGRRQWECSAAHRIGFLRTERQAPADEATWTRFGLAAQQAAAAVGFPRGIAAQLVAALGELHSNVYEHSGAPDSGLVVYRAVPGRFEFVVADCGIGVLESLRCCAEHSDLKDHGEALRLTLTEGVSRYGAGIGRGYGFRPLFVGLANLSGTLRFRSGDHALVIDGQNPSLMTARTAQKPFLKGLLVSVACDHPNGLR